MLSYITRLRITKQLKRRHLNYDLPTTAPHLSSPDLTYLYFPSLPVKSEWFKLGLSHGLQCLSFSIDPIASPSIFSPSFVALAHSPARGFPLMGFHFLPGGGLVRVGLPPATEIACYLLPSGLISTSLHLITLISASLCLMTSLTKSDSSRNTPASISSLICLAPFACSCPGAPQAAHPTARAAGSQGRRQRQRCTQQAPPRRAPAAAAAKSLVKRAKSGNRLDDGMDGWRRLFAIFIA